MKKIRYMQELTSELIELTQAGTDRKGFKSGITELDDLVLFAGGMVAIVTGHPGCGKSEIVDHLCCCWALNNNYRTLYFSPENHPISEHARKHVERITGKQISKVNKKELSEAIEFLDQYMAFMELPEDETASIDILLQIASEEMERRPFKILVLDPWNECQFCAGDREDLHISRSITKVKKFLRAHDILGIIVAHPRTPREKVTDTKGRQDYPVPKLADISGGGVWRAKADWGIVCHRHPDDNIMRMQVQKVKYKSLGKIGEIVFDYEWKTGRFKPDTIDTYTLPPLYEDVPF